MTPPPSRPSDASLDSSERPRLLIWEVTQACHLACTHCRANANPYRHDDELTTVAGKQLLEQTRDFGENQLVVLSGGDPLVREDIVELVDHGTDRGLTMSLTPSGTQSITLERLAALESAGLSGIAFSLDGATAERHDAFRGEPGSFEATIWAIEDAKSLGLPVQINTTVCAETVGDLPAISRLLEDLGVVMWSVFFLVPVGRGQLLDSVDPETAEAVMQWLDALDQSTPYAVKTTEAPHFRRVRRQRRGEGAASADGPRGRHQTGTIAGDGFVFVSHTGDVYPSGFLPRSAGNVRDRSVVDIYRNHPLFEALRDREDRTGKCGVCPFRQVCGGSRSRANAVFGDPLASDPLCPYVPPGYDGPLPWDRSASAEAAVDE